MFEACKSSGLITGSTTITAKDAYYVGIVLDIPDGKVVTVTVTDGKANVIDYLALDSAIHGNTRPHNVPVPILASGGITVTLSDEQASWIVYYAEQYFRGHRHV